jgi:STE24 endopeptidase
MQNYSLIFTLVFAAALIVGLLVRFYLATRQIRHVAQNRSAVPAAFAATISLESHQKAADYTIAKARFGLLEMAFGAALLLGWTLLGGIDVLSQAINNTGLASYDNLIPQLALLAAFAIISGLLDLPFTLYSTFKIEERYGERAAGRRSDWLASCSFDFVADEQRGQPVVAVGMGYVDGF